MATSRSGDGLIRGALAPREVVRGPGSAGGCIMESPDLPVSHAREVLDLVRAIEACPIPRRTPRFAPSRRLDRAGAGSLREEIIGGTGAYFVRRLLSALGFDEHRAMGWRLEHKLVQAGVLGHYAPEAYPRTWGLG